MNGQSFISGFGQFPQGSFFWSFIYGMPLFFKLMFLLVIGIFIFVIIKSIGIWSSNNASPLVSAYASAVTKRTEVWGGSGDSGAHTSYYVTFEFQDGRRVELQVPNKAFGLIVEGDRGELVYQGTRFKGFEHPGFQNTEG
ncbi:MULTISPECIES: DUF2500 domain-containing protein [Paenibacillus]|nr:DUF2500 domain-containing protein [Paenibacillus borealis]